MYYIVYGFLYLLSLLPMRVLYIFSDGLYLLLYYLIGYRKKVVMDNLMIVFPEKTKAEHVKIAKEFYLNFIDSFVEVIKLLSASDAFLQRRFTANTDALNELYKSGKACQIHLGHTFNWEWGQLVLKTLTPYKLMVVYMPITNAIFEKIFYKLRTRNGSIFLPSTSMKTAMLRYVGTQYLLGLVADQNPGKLQTAYWLDFFGKPTAFVSGPEKGARLSDLPVVFAYIEKPRRGYYNAVIEVATENAGKLPEGELTLKYAHYLEEVIRRNPSMWLWSHKRWKYDWDEQYEANWIGTGKPLSSDKEEIN
ncbi:MAG TPA: lysophospholipid acyltransferase family protein [Puia sp.]|nr:lysophospholipid acyltransferase family protein [Puia sp.]